MKKPTKKYMIYSNHLHMDNAEKTKILKNFPVFEGASESEMQKFAERMFPKIIRNMEVFVEEDYDEQQAFFVFKGAVSLFRTTEEGELINLALLGAPELVGEMGLIDTKPSTASAMAVGETHTLVLTQHDFKELMSQNHMISMRFLKVFSDKIRDFDIFVERLLSQSLYKRTWYLLQFLSKYFPDNEITLSQEELADLIWGTRSRVTEVLDQLESEGKIQIGRRKIKLLNL